MKQDFQVGVIGLGLIGGSLIRSWNNEGLLTCGFDVDEAAKAGARNLGIPIADSVEAVARNCSVGVVSVPPGQTFGIVKECLDASNETVVVDTASVKGPVVAAAGKLEKALSDRFLPAHPLAGSELAGWEASSADLLLGALWAVCPTRLDAPIEPLFELSNLLEALDSRMLACEASQHDFVLAHTSHAPHILASVLAASVSGPATVDRGLSAALSGGALRDMIRVASSDFELWRDIIELNEENVQSTLQGWSEELQGLADDTDFIETLSMTWAEGGRFRETVERIRWGDQEWKPKSIADPAWPQLFELGREGRTFRGIHLRAGKVELEVSEVPK